MVIHHEVLVISGTNSRGVLLQLGKPIVSILVWPSNLHDARTCTAQRSGPCFEQQGPTQIRCVALHLDTRGSRLARVSLKGWIPKPVSSRSVAATSPKCFDARIEATLVCCFLLLFEACGDAAPPQFWVKLNSPGLPALMSSREAEPAVRARASDRQVSQQSFIFRGVI